MGARHRAARGGLRIAAPLAAAGLVAACATAVPDTAPPAVAPAAWTAPRPHDGDPQRLTDWWRRVDDPLLAELIGQAQATSPTLAQALARVGEARAAARIAAAGRSPALDASVQASRSRSPANGDIPVSQAGAGIDAQWEIDLFGGLGHGARAAQARAEQAGLQWHDARVSLAAEVAQTYVGLRACEAQVAVVAGQAASQQTSAELTREKLRVGFETPANAALADAAAAASRERQAAQQVECDAAAQSLALLTTLPEPALRERLAARQGRLPAAPAFAVDVLPSRVLAQRPDIAAAERELVAAAADVGQADAQRYPHLSWSGNIGWTAVRMAGATVDGPAWGFGPALVMPEFDGGRRAGALDAARARYEAARAGFEQRARTAVREVEESLARIDAARRREADAALAAEGYRRYFESAQTRWRLGAGSLFEMEEARRSALASQAAWIAVQRDAAVAWINLYRAAGGGWDGHAEVVTDAAP